MAAALARRRPAPAFAALALALTFAAPRAEAEGVTVFAAASLRTALEEVEEAFEAEADVDLVVSYAGSSALARQIEAGAPADVFISANVAWMDRLEAEGLIAPATRTALLGNALVLIRHGPGAPAAEIGQCVS